MTLALLILPTAWLTQRLAPYDLTVQAVPQVCKVSGHVLELTWGYLLGEPPGATCKPTGWGEAGKRP
jgi:hypothetical protein